MVKLVRYEVHTGILRWEVYNFLFVIYHWIVSYPTSSDLKQQTSHSFWVKNLGAVWPSASYRGLVGTQSFKVQLRKDPLPSWLDAGFHTAWGSRRGKHLKCNYWSFYNPTWHMSSCHFCTVLHRSRSLVAAYPQGEGNEALAQLQRTCVHTVL